MGGPSGEIKYQPYVQDAHAEMLYGDTAAAYATGLAGDFDSLNMSFILTDTTTGIMNVNPYTGIAAYNPDTDLSLAQAAVDSYSGLISSVDETGTWGQMVDAAYAKLDTLLPSTAQVDSEVTAYEAAAKTQLANSYNRVAAGFSDINGVVGTAMPTALAMLELSFTTDVNRFRAERTHQADKNRAQAMLHSIDAMTNLLQTRIQGTATVAGMQIQRSASTIAAKEDQRIADTALSVDETFWRMRALRSGLDVLSGPSGVASGPEGPTKTERIMSGIGNSFAAGAEVGVQSGSLPLGLAVFGLGALATIFAANN